MKNLEQIQEENRKAIIIANNPEAKDYDEAVLLDIGCSEKLAKTRPDLAKDWKAKPLDLSRLLLALDSEACDLKLSYDNLAGDKMAFVRLDSPFNCEGKFHWNLTKPTLEEQTEETQREINKLLKDK